MFDKLMEVGRAAQSDLCLFDGQVVLRAVKWLEEGHSPQVVAQKVNRFVACIADWTNCTCDDAAHAAHAARVRQINDLMDQGKMKQAGNLAQQFISAPDYADPMNVEMFIDMVAIVCILRAPMAKMKAELEKIMIEGARILRASSPVMARIVKTIERGP